VSERQRLENGAQASEASHGSRQQRLRGGVASALRSGDELATARQDDAADGEDASRHVRVAGFSAVFDRLPFAPVYEWCM